jgi:hypothetical protein
MLYDRDIMSLKRRSQTRMRRMRRMKRMKRKGRLQNKSNQELSRNARKPWA